jgi:hypothetical protein
MIGLNLLNPDFVLSLPKPTFKSSLMLPRRRMSAQEFRPVNRARARNAKETKVEDDGEDVGKNGEKPISLEKDMSEKFNDVNDKKILSNLNNVNQKFEHGQSKIGRNKWRNRPEPRENPSTMTSNDLPPCTFKEDLAKMSGADSAAYFEATTESFGLGEVEEFILIKVSKGKRKCWGTFLSDDPELPYVDMFPIGTSVEKMLRD